MISTATVQNVEGYINDVLSGNIVVGRLVRLAIERHVRDLERQDTDEFPYCFDVNAASAACDFFPLMIKHSIGDVAGMPFILEPWQAFFVWSMFGWKRVCDGSRRFRKFFKTVARKNGKSTEVAAIAILLGMLDVNPVTKRPEDVAEIILCATKKEQVEKVIYAEIERMRVKSKHIEKASTRINKQITFKHNSGSIRCVGSDKPFDGLNPHAVLMDELHAWKEHHRKFYDTMQTGSGARSQPIIGTVTTAGDDQSHLWREEYEYAKSVLLGHVKDESLLAYIFEIDETDDPLDEAVWVKANPNLGVSVKLEYLREQAKPARTSKIVLNRFTRYHCNRLVSSTEKAFDLQQWDACYKPLSDWLDADAVGAGVDLGARDDLAAEAQCARYVIEERDGKPVYRYELQVQAYIGDDTKRDLTVQPWANWIYDGYILQSKYPIADLRDNLIEKCAQWGIPAVAYDPYNAQFLAEELQKEGLVPARMAQNQSNFNEPLRDFIQAIADGRVTHDGNPLLRKCIENSVIFSDRADRWMLDKKTSIGKIDPVVAVVMAFRMCQIAPTRASGMLYLS